MEWACTNCGRTYHDPPEDVCQVCSAGTVVPADEAAERTDAFLDRLRRVVLDPGSLDTGLAETNDTVSLVFGVIAVLSVLFLLVVVLGILL